MILASFAISRRAVLGQKCFRMHMCGGHVVCVKWLQSPRVFWFSPVIAAQSLRCQVPAGSSTVHVSAKGAAEKPHGMRFIRSCKVTLLGTLAVLSNAFAPSVSLLRPSHTGMYVLALQLNGSQVLLGSLLPACLPASTNYSNNSTITCLQNCGGKRLHAHKHLQRQMPRPGSEQGSRRECHCPRVLLSGPASVPVVHGDRGTCWLRATKLQLLLQGRVGSPLCRTRDLHASMSGTDQTHVAQRCSIYM